MSTAIERAAEKYRINEGADKTERYLEKAFMAGAFWQQSQLPERQDLENPVWKEVDKGFDKLEGFKNDILPEQEVKAVGDDDLEQLKLTAWEAWHSAANAYRIYPDNKHTFTDYWANLGKDKAKAALIIYSQPKVAVGDAEIEKLAEDYCKGYPTCKKSFIAGYKAVLQPNVSEQIAAYVHEIDSLRETNRKLGEKIAELQKEIDEKNKEICDLLDWGNGKDAELERLEKKITEIQNDYMQVQTNQQLAKFKKEERK